MNDHKLNIFAFDNIQEMSKEMKKKASDYEGYVPGRIGYNFPNKDGSYTIAHVKGDIHTKNHELRHAEYYFNEQYRNAVNDLWSSLDEDTKHTIEQFLKRCGYCQAVFVDEFQAYLFTEKEPEKFFGLKKGTFSIKYNQNLPEFTTTFKE